MLIEITKIGVTNKGKDIPVGEQVETDEASANALITDGYAKKAVAENAPKPPVNPLDTSGDKLPAGAGGGQTDGKQESDSGKNEGTVGDHVASVKKALNNKCKRDELYEAAKAAGVEIPEEATKAVIIDALIAQGKADALLK